MKVSVVDVVMRGAQSEVQNVKNFVTTPTGVFETADKIIVDARRTVRNLVSAVGITPSAFKQRGGRVRIRNLRVLRRR